MREQACHKQLRIFRIKAFGCSDLAGASSTFMGSIVAALSTPREKDPRRAGLAGNRSDCAGLRNISCHNLSWYEKKSKV